MDNEIAIDENSKMTSQIEQSNITGLGERLKKARESMHLTQKEAAARLYLNPKIVEIIENEAFFEGPPMTFMRGYIRSYAKLLNVPENDIKADIANLEFNVAPATPTAPVLQTNPTYRGDRYIRWITYLIVLVLISLVVLWWSSNAKYIETPAAATMVQTPTTTAAPTTPEETPVTTPTAETVVTPTPQTSTIAPPTQPTEKTIKPAIEKKPPVETTPASINTTTDTPPAVSAQPETAQPAAETPTSNMTAAPAENGLIPETTPPNVSTMVPSEEKAEKPAPKLRKKHRRHQYRPIENMEIPEPD